jgi:hypothetical protein
MADIGYYQPYESDTDSEDSSDESEYWSTSEEEEALITSPVSLLRTAGPAFANQKDALLDSRTNQYSSVNSAFSAPEQLCNVHNGINLGSTNFNIQPRAVESIINVASQDRDYAVFSNPTEFTLHLPRVYKNVTNFDIQQIKFLNAFYYFRNDKNNTFYDYIEQGRISPNLSNYPPTFDSNTPYKLRVNIREGSYNITQLLQELQYQLNTPPLFFYFPNGFVDFAPLFAGSGNLGLSFNEPGSFYYDSLNNVFIANPTKEYIITQYFATQNAGLTFYSFKNIQNAYYYPVIREIFLDPTALPQLNLTNPAIATNLLPNQTIETRIIYDFQGLDDEVPYLIIQDNQEYLDIYRTEHTFLAAPINQYSFRVDTFNQRLTIFSSGLNTSIVNTFSGQLNSNLRLAYLSCNLDSNGVQYSNLVTSNQKLLSIFSQMKDYLYQNMANYFGIPFNSYSIEQLTDYSSLYNMRDGINSCNVPLNYDPYSNVPLVPNYNLTDTNPIQYDRFSNITTCNFNIVTEPSVGANVVKRNFQVDVDGSDLVPNPNSVILTSIPFINYNSNSNDIIGNVRTNPKKRSLDIVADIDPYNYTVFSLKSTIRQTIQIETIPVPHKFRYYTYTQTYGATSGNYFNNFLDFCNNSIYLSNIESNFSNENARMSSSNIVTGATGDIGQNSNAGLTGANTYPLNITDRVKFFKFTTPNSSITPSSNIQNFYMNITIQLTSNYPESNTPITAYLYGDKSAYLNDMYCYYTTTNTTSNIFSNLSSNYLLSNSFSNNSNLTFSNEYQNNKEYYLIVTGPLTAFSSLNFKVYSWFSNNTLRIVSNDIIGNPNVDPLLEFYEQPPESNADMYKTGRGTYTNLDYYRVYDRVYNKLPINSNLYQNTNPEDNSFNDPVISDGPPIGYDTNGVSTDLTDYKGFINPVTPNIYSNFFSNGSNVYTSQVRLDPANNYVFNSLTPYNSNTQMYLGSNSLNQIIDGSTGTTRGNIYTPTVVAKRQYKIVHWHDTTYFPPQELDWYTSNSINYKEPPSTNFSLQITPYGGNLKNNVLLGVSGAKGYRIDGTATNNYIGTPFQGDTLFNTLNGISGISFLPTDGSWDIDTFMFKSAYFDSNSDPNLRIAYVGIFDLQDITNYNINDINMSNAIFLLERIGATYYTTTNSNFYNLSNFGFDMKFGAYHSFKVMDDYINSNSNGRISGYTQTYTNTLDTDRNFYTMLPFDSSGKVINYYMLCGSPVPHPEITAGKWSSLTNDGVDWNNITISSLPYSNILNLIVPDTSSNPSIPAYIPTTVFNPTGSNGLYVSQYEQSLPIGTQNIQVKEQVIYFNDSEANYTYNPSPQPINSLSNFKLTHAYYKPVIVGYSNSLLTFAINGYSNTSNTLNQSYIINQGTLSSPNRFIYTYPTSNNTTSCNNYNLTTALVAPGTISLPSYSTYTNCNIIAFSEDVFHKYVLAYYYTSPTSVGAYAYYEVTDPFGTAGVTGPYGVIDNVGLIGKPGSRGATGVTGSQGARGITGATGGDTGGRGGAGGAGGNGSGGGVGGVGAIGGVTGGTGGAGLTGETGAPGLTGATGPSTIQGATGATGASATQRGETGATGTPLAYYRNLDYTSNILLANSASATAEIRIFNIAYNSTNAVLMSGRAGTLWTNYIMYLDEFPGFSGLTAVCINGDPRSPSVRYYLSDVAPFSTDSYIYVLTNSTSNTVIYQIPTGNPNGAITMFQFDNSLAGKIIDIKCDSFGNVYYITTDDPTHLHRLGLGTYLGYFPTIPKQNLAQTYQINKYTAIDTTSAFSFDRSILSNFSWTIGRNNSIFYQWYDQGATGPWQIEGSVLNDIDYHIGLSSRYNIFYPTMKIVLNKKTNDYNSITDTSNLLVSPSSSNNISPEFGRTFAYFYSNGTNLSNDLMVSSNQFKWGYESNFTLANTKFNGYYFNSYIYNIKLPGNPLEKYYIALRGSRPTEQYQTILRVKAPNRLDFGFVSMSNLFSEVTNVYTSVVSNYNPSYATNLSNFNQQFVMTNRYFGGGAINGFLGVPITTSNTSGPYFSNFLSQISNYYGQYLSNAAIINAIDSNASSNFSNYLYTYWSNILPGYALQRDNPTDPVPFSLLFLSSIPDGRYRNLDEGWGIGWNLGFPKQDTPYDTVQTANSFYKIFEDYLFLRLNPEQNMNRVDYTSREHLDRTLDTQGTIDTYYGKLLLNTFGNYATTFVGNPIEFNPPVSRLDKLNIEWLDAAGNALDNVDCEWNAVLRIIENVPTATTASTIPALVRIEGSQQQLKKNQQNDEQKKAEEDKKKAEEEQQKI